MDLGSARKRAQGPAGPPSDGHEARETPEIVPGPVSAARGSAVRRAVDVIGALGLLVLTFPVLVVGAVRVWWVAGRPVFFAHRRVGRGGAPFWCWKLRTMETGAEERLRRDRELRRRHRDKGFKLPEGEDPRVVPGTEWLRRSHIDELPQLVNVLRGEMSLIGPRPLVREELALYGDEWRILVSRRPGLVGAWTSLGSERPPYPERAELELDYVRRAGLWTDVRIVVRTLTAPFRRRVGG